MNNKESSGHQTIFSQKADFYKCARPNYPAPVFEYLASLLEPGSSIVEFGCGTGIFTQELVKYNYEIYAIDPCTEMLAACSSALTHYDKITFIQSSAEEVSLDKASIDAFVLPQSLHWMNIEKLKKVIAHAAKDKFAIMTVWNSRDIDSTDSAKVYNKIVASYKTQQERHIQVETDSYSLLNQLYGKNKYKLFKFHHTHQLTQQGVEYLFLSTSYVDLDAMSIVKKQLDSWYNKYHVNGYISIEYDCFMAISKS